MFLRGALERLKESKRSESMQTKVRWSNVNKAKERETRSSGAK